MTNRSDWEGRVGRKWADEWRRTDRAFAGVTERLLAIVRSGPVHNVLDIGCGAGELSLAIAREHARAQVVGVDVSEPLIEEARGRGSRLTNARFFIADAAEWRDPDASPDLLVSRHGVMFFAEPVAAFAHLASISTPGARLAFSCFRDRTLNSWASKVADLLSAGSVPSIDPQAPGPFAFADTEHVGSILGNAGWRDIVFEALDFAYVAGTGDDPVDDALTFFLAIGPAAAVAAELDPEQRREFVDRLRELLAHYRHGSIVAMPAAAWIVTARKPST